MRQITATEGASSMQPGDSEDTNTAGALRPAEPEPGVLVHTSADRRLATEHWLLSTVASPRQARLEWTEHGVAMMPLGTLFSAVRIP